MILASFLIPILLNFQIKEWGWNDRMVAGWEVSQNSVFLSTSKDTIIPPHSVIPLSFQNAKKWHGMKITMDGYHSVVILLILTSFQSVSSFKNDDGMTEWGWNEGYFWFKAKPLVLKYTSFHHHSIIPCECPIGHMVILFI